MSPLFAQRDSTRALQAVTVRGYTPERFMGGLKVQRADSALLQTYKFQTLAEFLATQAPFQLKSYGTGQLTTVGLRGASSSHTAVLWNGVNINLPFSSLTDFSTIPLAGFEQLSIQYGSSASVVGTDAVGGSILLNSAPSLASNTSSVQLGQRVASFQNYQTQLTARFAQKLNKNWQLSGKTALYGGQLNNRLPYTERRGFLVEPSETAQKGLIQDLYFRHQNHQQVSLNVWLSDNHLALAPTDPVSREITQTKSYRFLSNYELGRTTLRAGFVRDVIDYGKGPTFETDPYHSETNRLILRGEHEFSFKKLTTRIGSEWVHFRTRVDDYDRALITENRADFYALTRYQLSPRWLWSFNLRQAFVTNYDPPLAPSLGTEYRLINHTNQQILLKANVARSYRVPTLNERYWRNLGNPDIRPEHGFGQEAGIEIKQIISPQLQATGSITAFHNRMDDWTYWNPARGYRVENLQLVVARGLEVQGSLNYKTTHINAGLFVQYALTRSSQERVYDATAIEVVGKQLIYLPLHTGSANAFVEFKPVKFLKPIRCTMTWQGSSRRYYTFDNSKFLRGYQLVGAIIESGWQVGRLSGRVVLQADNIFDALYLNVKRNAMPGRNFAANLIFQI
ncbi:MAG: TonB-dependent receptor plug domain-containing protein [Spirosomaceae bacterium]|jgi:iron complex outermembrane receptor protein|nr:TonB-dependent receptor plug domain-containing protein [Spirosomataceae bacterium]